MNFVLSFNLLSPHEHALIPVGEFGCWEYLADSTFHVDIPNVNADTLACKRPYQTLNLLGPSFHSDFFTKIRAGANLIWSEPRHPMTAVLKVHRPENWFMTPCQYCNRVAHDESRTEMVAVAHQIPGILSPEHEQGIKI